MTFIRLFLDSATASHVRDVIALSSGGGGAKILCIVLTELDINWRSRQWKQ